MELTEYPAMEIYLFIIFVVFGSVVGSFLNVVIDRLPAGQSLAYPPSHCPACGKKLAVKDLFPVFSYLQASTGAAFGLLFLYLGLHPQLVIALLYFSALLAITVIDLNHQLILNRIIYPLAIVALVVDIAIQGFSMSSGWGVLVVPGLWNAGIGFAIGLVLFLLIVIASRGGMGLGDVKMAALMGLMLGIPSLLVGIFLAILSGGIIALILLAFKKKGRKQAIPFGPFLAMGTMLAMLWGPQIWQGYLHLFN
jgi:leader peptidase (prepilin peptidase) / N-methyltransferase